MEKAENAGKRADEIRIRVEAEVCGSHILKHC